MASKYKRQRDQLIERHEASCHIRMDADRIEVSLEGVYPSAVSRVADEMENMRLCAFVIVDESVIYLMHPDYGMFADDDEFRTIVSELFDEENYELIYVD